MAVLGLGYWDLRVSTDATGKRPSVIPEIDGKMFASNYEFSSTSR